MLHYFVHFVLIRKYAESDILCVCVCTRARECVCIGAGGSPHQMSFSPLWRPYSLRSRPEKGKVFLRTAVYSIVNRFKCCSGLSHLQGDSNSINRNFNIYSLGGFPPIIYDDQRDVKGGHLFPL